MHDVVSPLGAVGFVDVALELADQVRQDLVPEPATIVVALESGGTAAGLLVGCGPPASRPGSSRCG